MWNGDRFRLFGSRGSWENFIKIDRDNIIRVYGSVDIYSSRRRSIVI